MIHHTVKTAALGLFLKWWEEEREWGQEICEWVSLLNLVISLYSFRKTWLLPGSAWPKKKKVIQPPSVKKETCLHACADTLPVLCWLAFQSWQVVPGSELTWDTHIHRERRRGKIGLVSGLAPETSEPEALMSRQFLMLFFFFTHVACFPFNSCWN